MARNASAPHAKLIRLLLCLSLLAQPLLSGLTNASAGRSAANGNPPVSNKVAVRQEAEAADLPDLNEARNRPHHEPHAIPPVPSKRRRCPPRNRRCNDDIDGPPRPAATPQTPPGRDGNPHSLASVTTQSLLAVLSAAMNGGRPVFDLPLLDYFSNDGGYSVSDSATSSGVLPSLYTSAAAPLVQAQPNASVFVAQSVPTVMQVGQQYNVAVTMRNTGTNTWTSAANYNLSSQNPQDNSTWGMTRVPLPASIAPGTEVTFTFTVTAPATPGTYNFQWRMVQDGVAWFGDYTSNVSVTVASAAMVGRWKFDEGSGGVVVDSSGNGNTGTLRNGPAWVTGTVGTGALDFDGVDDSISVPGSATINAVKNNFTVSFWAYPRSTHEIDAESTTGASGVSGQKYVWGPNWYDYNNGGAGAGISVGTNGVSVYEHGPNYMPSPLVYQGTLSGWTHVTIVYQNKQPRLYINGTLVRTGLTSPRTSVGIIPWDIGGMVYGYFNGQLDDVRLYNGVLSAGEITALANTPGRLVALWKFDEGSGTTASDATGNGSTGTLQNGPAWVAGKVGAGALSFDGVNDGITVSSGAPLTSVSNDFAITFWANPRSAHEIDPEGTTGVSGVSGQRYAFGPLNYGSTSEVGAGVSVGTNGVSIYEHGAGYMPATLVYQGTLSGWTHVAVVYENRQPRLYLNGTLVRVGYTSPASTVRVAPWNLGGNSYGYFDGQLDDVRVFKGALTASDVQALYGGQGTGLTGEYYDNIDLTGYALTRTDPTVSFDWGNNAPTGSMGTEQFSVRWAGTVVPRYSETYTFYTTTDDGVRLWIDGQLLIDKWVDQGPTEWTGQMTLEAGRAYAVRMEFYENFGGAQAKLSWSSASQGKEIIPQTQLNGCWKDVGQFARDFYQGALNRQPYAAELTEWTENLTQAQSDDGLVATAQTLGANVFNSSEYAARNRSDVDYVSDLYWAYLQRAPDASGLSFWSGPIIACGSDQQCRAAQRANVRTAFDQSGEFREKVRVLCGASAAAPDNGGVGYDFSTARLDPNNRTGGEGADPYSRNFNFSIPIMSLPGRAGLDLGLALTYNSLVWTKDSTGITYDADGGFPSPGFRLGFPVIEPKFVNPQLQQAGQPTKSSYLLVTPSGTHVELRQTATAGVYESADSSYLQLTESGGVPGVLRSIDGTQLSFVLVNGSYRCYQVKDRNGNYISVAYNSDGGINTITDTLGRTITFRYDAYQNLLSIEQPWRRETEANPNPTQDELHVWASFGYMNLTLQPSFSNLAVIGDQPGMTIPVLSQIGLDDGSYFKFYYNQWGQVWKATYFAVDSRNAQGQPNDSHALSFTRLDLPGSDLSAASPQTDCPRFTQAKTWIENGLMNLSGEVTTSYGTWGPNMASCEVTMSDLTTKQVSYYGTAADRWKKGLTTSQEVKSSGQLMKTTTLSWEHDGTTSAAYPPTNPRVTQTTVSDPQSHTRTTRVTYTAPADFQGESGYTGTLNISLPKKVEECDAGCVNVLRATVNDYKVANLNEYVSRRILGLRRYEYLYEGGVAPANLRSQVGYVYDEPNDSNDTFLAATATSAWQHDSASYGQAFRWRGSVNRMRRYSVDQQTGATGTYVEARTAYTTTGTVAYSKDASNHKTSFDYADSFLQNVNRTTTDPLNQLKTYAYPTTVTDPDNFTTTAVYNYDMGVASQRRAPLPNVVTNQPGPTSRSYYDAAGRLIKQLIVDSGAYTRWVYPDKMDAVLSYTLIETGVETYTTQVLDGIGRTRATAIYLPPTSDTGAGTYAGNYSGRKFDFDEMGRQVRQTNPAEVTASWVPAGDDSAGWVYTRQSYDWKGRPLVTTSEADNSTIVIDYGGCGCAGGEVKTVSGEVVMLPPDSGSGAWTPGRRSRKIYQDILGRDVKVEVLKRDGTPYATTVTDYDARDQVTAVKEYEGPAPTDGSCPTGTCQKTSMTYDGHGRLRTERAPEQTAATQYDYNDDDTLSVVTDPRGATATYGYFNNRHLVNQIVYGAPAGIEAATTLTFTYDAVGNRKSQTDKAGSVDYVYDNLSRLTSETRKFASLNNAPYPLTYAYNLADQVTSVTDPYNVKVEYKYNRAGSLKAVTDGGSLQYASAMQYRAWGALKQVDYGNGLRTKLEFDTRMRVRNYRVGLPNAQPGPSDRALSDYVYEDDGRIKAAYDRTDSGFDRTYLYDNVGRLMDARTTNSAYYEWFGYDEFGHMTSRASGSWRHFDTTVSQYQNNRNTSTTVIPPSYPPCCPPQPVTWTYDASGQVTHDHNKEYSYDASGEEVRVFETKQSGTQTDKLWIYQDYDADGQSAKRVEQTQTNSGPFSFTTLYYVRSSVLDDKVIMELDASGAKSKEYVYAGGPALARQENNQVRWVHLDPVTNGLRETASDGSPVSRVEFDPLGNDAPLTDPLPPESSQDYEYPGTYNSNGNPYDGPSGCSLDGQPVPCGLALGFLNVGAAGLCPDNRCGVHWDWGRGGFVQPMLSDEGWGNGLGGWVMAWGVVNAQTGRSVEKWRRQGGTRRRDTQRPQQRAATPPTQINVPIGGIDKLKSMLEATLAYNDCRKAMSDLIKKLEDMTGSKAVLTDVMELFNMMTSQTDGGGIYMDFIRPEMKKNIPTRAFEQGTEPAGGSGLSWSFLPGPDPHTGMRPANELRRITTIFLKGAYSDSQQAAFDRLPYDYMVTAIHELTHQAAADPRKLYSEGEIDAAARQFGAKGLDDYIAQHCLPPQYQYR